MTLYDMTREAKALYDVLSGETDTGDFSDEEREQIISDTMESIGADDKLESYCKVVRQMEADAAMCAVEIKRLSDRKSKLTNGVERMKTAMLDFYNAAGYEKPVDAGIFKISRRRSEKTVVTDKDLVPDEFWKVKREADLTAIKAKIKSGETVPGAELVENFSIQIK